MSHLDALKELYPLSQTEEQLAMMEIEAGFLDEIQTRLAATENDIFPETTTKLAKMEQALGLDSRGSMDDRIKAVVARQAASGGISRPFFRDLAEVLGYQIEYGEQEKPFRVGYSHLGEQLWSLDGPESPWRWKVLVTDLGLNATTEKLQTIFDDLKPAFTEPTWILETSTDQGDGEIIASAHIIDEGDGELVESYPGIDEGDGERVVYG